MFPEGHCFQVISTIFAVDQIRVGVELLCFNPHTVSSVLHHAVTEAAVTHLRNKGHVLLALFFVCDFPAVQRHQPHELLNLRTHQQCANILLPLAAVIGVPGLCFRAEAGVLRIALTEQVSHTSFIPGIPSAVFLIGQFRVYGLDVEHLSADFFGRDIAPVGELKQFISHCPPSCSMLRLPPLSHYPPHLIHSLHLPGFLYWLRN